MGQTAVIPAQIVDVAARSLLGNNTNAAAACQTISFSAASAGQVLTVQGDGSVAFAAPSGGIGGSTGSTDNAVLRADGTAGDTLQDSGWIIPDIFTASPNATVNHLSLQATGSSTNVSVSIVPKGSGAFSLQVPDGTTAGGNARGANAVDLQTLRTASSQVASGTGSLVSGFRNTASSAYSVAFGVGCTAQTGAEGNLAGGYESTASGGQSSFAWGNRCTASGAESSAVIGYESSSTASACWATGRNSLANRFAMYAHASGQFAAKGDCQRVEFVLRNKTTTNSAVTLFLDGALTRLTIPSGKILHATVQIVGSKSDGTAVASYMRQVTIKNVGGTTSLVGTVNTIGTDEAASTSIAITADDTNDALDIAVTGIASETWRWAATVFGIEIAYGS
jgi:hypothetical protein